MTEKRKYDSTVARMAGNIAPSLIARVEAPDSKTIAAQAVRLARAIIAEVIATEPSIDGAVLPVSRQLEQQDHASRLLAQKFEQTVR